LLIIYKTFLHKLETMKKLIIAIDGPAGSGKSTTARLVAEKLGYIYIDTGAMYRAVTLAWLRSKKEMTDEVMIELMDKFPVELIQSPQGQRTMLAGEDVSDEIRSPDVTKFVSPVSAMECVRIKMVAQQRRLGEKGGVVMDGRDIGTVVFPNADLKVFLIASIDARAYRRMLELKAKGIDFSEEEIKQQIAARDKYDSTREISPLRKAEDAIELDTSNISIEEQVAKVLELIAGRRH
jgi:CMP/dCMP kinase